MKPTEVVKLVEDLWRGTVPDKRLGVLGAVRKIVPEEYFELFDALIDVKISGLEDDPNSVVLVLIHGIQTDGSWHNLVNSELRDINNLNIIGLGYDCVTPFQLVSPFRSRPIDKVTKEIRDLRRREPKARLIVIAHSFGSYIVSEILRKNSDINFEKIILCGSIIPRDFNWNKYAPTMARGSIINDIGTLDIYPVLATCASIGYGASGFRGFQNSLILDRYFPYGHSSFFEKERKHIRRFWRPFIETGKIRNSFWNIRKPKIGIALLMLSHPWIGRSIACSLVIFILGAFAWFFT